MKISQIQEGIKFSRQDYDLVLNDPKIQVGYEIEFVALASAFNSQPSLQIKSIDQIAQRDSYVDINDLSLDFDIDWSSVAEFQEKYIHDWCQLHAKTGDLRSTASLLKIIKAEVRTSKTDNEVSKLLTSAEWNTYEGRLKILNSLWVTSSYMALKHVWLENLINSQSRPISEIFQNIKITPKHGWVGVSRTKYYSASDDDEDDDFNSDIEKQIISELNQLGLHGHVSTEASLTNWQLTLDMSIYPDHEKPGYGFELVSPPTAVGHALEDLKKVFAWMESHGHYTNKTTGFHVGVSWGKKSEMQKIDKLKVVLLMGEQYVMQLFDRTTNDYTQSHIEKLQGKISKTNTKWKSDRDVQTLIAKANKLLDKQKYRTVNLDKLSSGYLEFRIMGGEDYHKRLEDVKKIIIRYAFVIKAALDPSLFKQEYEQELGKLISTALANAQPKYADLMTKYAVRGSSTPKNHDSMLSYFQRAQQAFERDDPYVVAKIMGVLLTSADKLAQTGQLSAEEVKASALSYRLFLKKHGWNTSDLAQAMTKAKIKPVTIAAAENYLNTY